MATIEVDFDVYKALTVRRRTEDVSYNDVLREMLELPPRAAAPQAASEGDWITNGVRFPEGTEFRGTYKGKPLRALVRQGALHLNGKAFSSPSVAAMSVTGYAVNGWHFWECLFPGATTWRNIDELRKLAA